MEYINYQLPRFGNVFVELYENSKQLLRLLDKQSKIAQLKTNPQLGLIHKVYEGAHHTRWEYAVVKLHILNTFYNESPKIYGLSSKIKINGRKISGIEIIQYWILLLNMGHLKNTFVNERFLLQCLKHNKKIKETFYRGLPQDKLVKEYANHVLSKDKVYQVHELLSFFKLIRMRNKNNKVIIDTSIELLKLYRLYGDDRDKIINLRSIYKNIRLFSFLYLDSQYTNIPVFLDLGQLILNFKDHANELFMNNDSELNRSLIFFQDLMCENFYLSSRVLRLFYFHLKDMSKRIDGDMQKITDLNNFINNNEKLSIRNYNYISDFNLRLNFKELSEYNNFISDLKYLDFENVINNKLPNYCRCTLEKDFSHRTLITNFAFSENITKKQLLKAMYTIYSQLSNLKNKYKRSKQYYSHVNKFFETAVKNSLLFTLNSLWGDRLEFIASYQSKKHEYILNRGIGYSLREIKKLIDYYNTIDIDKDSLNEITCLHDALSRISHKGIILFTVEDIFIRDKHTSNILTDIDSCSLLISSSSIKLLLIEAKNQHKRRHKAARNQICNKIESLGFSTSGEACPKDLNKGVYSIINLDKAHCNNFLSESVSYKKATHSH